ncbi:tetratricopeptide repeat protein [Treponema sp.]|uniref:tetratricopeptide repeat protein n=1 Tax=Treponema sp. TaxID=166 RepID=UPI00298ED028|nr:tetratricopeptide repeat protein [Treponema sp.]MCQ2240602.1 tetratricopeptide repeat protein [Treponema sp.]
MKTTALLSLGFLSLSLVSCGTLSKVRIPGETKLIQRNISEEYFSIAETYKGQSNYSKAIEYYTLALDNKELHESAFYQIALCQVYSKNWAPARKSFVKLLKKDPENSSLKMSLAYIEAMCGNLKKAGKMYEFICSERPDDSEPLVNYINVLIAAEKYDKAKEKLELLENKFPDEEHLDNLKKKITELTEDETEKKSEENPDGSSENADDSQEELFGLTEEDTSVETDSKEKIMED